MLGSFSTVSKSPPWITELLGDTLLRGRGLVQGRSAAQLTATRSQTKISVSPELMAPPAPRSP